MGIHKYYDNYDKVYAKLSPELIKHRWNIKCNFNLTYHKRMWEWLGEHPDKSPGEWIGWYVGTQYAANQFKYRDYMWPILKSFPCEYMTHNFMSITSRGQLYAYCRQLCPLIWPNGLECWNREDGCFSWYSEFYIAYNIVSETKGDIFYKNRIYELANNIANLPVRDEVNCI